MFSLFGCGMQKLDGDGMVYKPAYVSISQDEAKLMMQDDDGHVILDVRRADEYAQGHIPGAILIPNESITDTPPEELPDKYQIILVYCRTGRRSKEASQKLADMEPGCSFLWFKQLGIHKAWPYRYDKRGINEAVGK